MRLDRFYPSKSAPDPLLSGMHSVFESDVGVVKYDIYLIGGIVYVFRGDAVAVFQPCGNSYANNSWSKQLAFDFARKFPRLVSGKED